MSSSFVTAIAGSAGSLQSLKDFFDSTPCDKVTYVIVQHLPKTYTSQLNIILEKYSALDIIDVTQGMEIGENRIYVAPSSKYMTIAGNHFVLQERSEPVNRSMDIFLTSVAANYGQQAIGILLSGMDHDGVAGIKKIKEMGGLTIAQDPATSEYPTLVENAIRTRHIDKILDPKEMPGYIQEYVHEMISKKRKIN